MNTITTTKRMEEEPQSCYIHKIGIIIPSATHQIPQSRINNHFEKLITNAKRSATQRGEAIEIHVMAGKRSAIDTMTTNAQDHPQVSVIVHNPSRTKHATSNGAKRRQTAARMAGNLTGLIVVQTDNRTNGIDRQITAKVKSKNPKAIRTERIVPTPPTEKVIPLPLPQSEYRINLSTYATLAECIHAIPCGKTPVYCGRANVKKDAPQSILANPYKMGTTAENIADYKIRLQTLIAHEDPRIMAALRDIDADTPLICYCHDRKPCHTDVIREEAAKIRKADQAKIAKEIAKSHAKQTTTCHAKTKKGSSCTRDKAAGNAHYCTQHQKIDDQLKEAARRFDAAQAKKAENAQKPLFD